MVFQRGRVVDPSKEREEADQIALQQFEEFMKQEDAPEALLATVMVKTWLILVDPG